MRVHQAILRRAAVCALFLTLAVGACGRRVFLPDDTNVILITIDTLRADHLGCYGHPTVKTPVIDRLATEGVRFSRATSQSHITQPSHVSILTSRHPREHGVLDNNRAQIPDSISTLGAVLKGAGFRTVAVTSVKSLSPVHVKGLRRGFDTFYRPSRGERDAAATNEVFLRWLRRHHKERFFAWVHYFDPHLPYAPPEPYASMYYSGDPRDPKFTSMGSARFGPAFTDPNHWAYSQIAWLDGIRDFRYAVSRYEGEVSYVDAMIGEILGRLAALGLDRRTLVVLTADHGESLDENGIYLGHFALYQSTTRVPLIFWAPTVLHGPRTVDALVMSIDIMPTILDLVRLEPPADVSGRSLVPLLAGAWGREPHSYAYAEGQGGRQVMIRSADWEYIETRKAVAVAETFSRPPGARELYHLAEDPGETNNLYAVDHGRAQELQQALVGWEAARPAPPTLDEPRRAPAEFLKALGYAQ